MLTGFMEPPPVSYLEVVKKPEFISFSLFTTAE